MPFKVKDLMINIGPGEPVGGWLSRFPCGCGCTYGYTQGCPNTGGGGGGHQTLFFARVFDCELNSNVIGGGQGGGGGHTETFAWNPDPVPWALGAGGAAPAFRPCFRNTALCLCTYLYTHPCLPATVPCLPVTFPTPQWLCPTPTAIGPVGVPPGGDPAVVSQQLAALKVQLQQELAEIEKQQEAVNASLKPQTIAQVDELLGKMREAIDELEKRKAELAKKK